MTSAPAIGFEYRPSRWLMRLPAAMLALALLALAACGLVGWLKLWLAATATGLWLHALRHRPDAGVTAAGWAGGDGGWSLHRGGLDAPATLVSFRVLGAFVLLRLREGGDRRVTTLLLAPDNSDADIRRRLRMRLTADAAPVR